MFYQQMMSCIQKTVIKRNFIKMLQMIVDMMQPPQRYPIGYKRA